MVITDDLKHIRWYNAKSNYQKSMKSKPGNSMEGIHAIIKLNENSLSHRHVFLHKYLPQSFKKVLPLLPPLLLKPP